jgi:hypothetical protein
MDSDAHQWIVFFSPDSNPWYVAITELAMHPVNYEEQCWRKNPYHKGPIFRLSDGLLTTLYFRTTDGLLMLWYRYWDCVYHARFALLSDFKSSICSTHNSGDILGISLSRQQRSPHNTMLYECTLCQRSTYQCNNLLVLLHCCKGICTRSCLYHEVLAGESDRPQESV